ncbi:MAG: cation:proton antiporter [Candidatus Paceibacterota bacterium]
MEQFLPFFLILLAGVFFSEVFRRFNLPWVIALLLAGVVIGPHAAGFIELDETLSFIGQIGLVFLMFMAGIETKITPVRGMRTRVIFFSLVNSFIPFVVGVGLTVFLGFSIQAALLVGIIFISSSLSVVVPTLTQVGLINNRMGHLIVPSAVLQDVLSLAVLSIVFQAVDPISSLPLPLFYLILFSSLFLLRWVVPKIETLMTQRYVDKADIFQQQLRMVLTLMIGTVIIFELLGLHPIIAGFFAGLILSDTIKGDYFKEKLRAVSYGVFIPVFFVITGARTDVSVFFEAGRALALTALIVTGSIIAKFGSGWLAARAIGEKGIDATLVASATIPQLTTTLAVITIGIELGLLTPSLVTGLITLSIVTTIVSPLLLNALAAERSKLWEQYLAKTQDPDQIAEPTV